jgi:hypothetical protein
MTYSGSPSAVACDGKVTSEEVEARFEPNGLSHGGTVHGPWVEFRKLGVRVVLTFDVYGDSSKLTPRRIEF